MLNGGSFLRNQGSSGHVYMPPVEVLTKEVMGLVALWVGVCFIVVIAPTYLVMDRKSISLRTLWGW